MKGKVFTGLLAVSLSFAALPAVAQDAQKAQPEGEQSQFQAFHNAQRQQWRKTADLRQQVLLKRQELATLMINPKATEAELLKKQQELQDVRAKLEKEQLTFMFQMKQKYPEVMESYAMMGYGMGPGTIGGGYGLGPCGTGYGLGYGMGGGYGRGYGMGGGYGLGPGMGGYGMAPPWHGGRQ